MCIYQIRYSFRHIHKKERKKMLNPKENREIWLKAANESRGKISGRVKNGIERYRKGLCRVRLTDSDGNPVKGAKIRIDQQTHDFGFGANIFMLDEFPDESDNKTYREQFKRFFNLATVPFYWSGLEPEQGKPRYGKDSPKVWRRPAPERCMEYCEENGIMPKLHCLVYDKAIPEWLPINDMRAMEAYYEERFRQISERFCGRMLEFEVINELLCEYVWNFKSVISGKRDIVEWAFALAEKYFPNETLVINEGEPSVLRNLSNYRNGYFLLIENALKSGARINKIGMQHHIFTGANTKTDEEYESQVKQGDSFVDPEKILAGLDRMAEFSLPLEMTEVTVPTFGTTDEDEELQADLLELMYTLWFSHPAMEDIVYWNLPDGYAYSDGIWWDENRCRGGLFHHDLSPKKSALRLEKLTKEIWHTKEEITTDENGYAEFRGFFGNYSVCGEGFKAEIGLHNGGNILNEIKI